MINTRVGVGSVEAEGDVLPEDEKVWQFGG